MFYLLTLYVLRPFISILLQNFVSDGDRSVDHNLLSMRNRPFIHSPDHDGLLSLFPGLNIDGSPYRGWWVSELQPPIHTRISKVVRNPNRGASVREGNGSLSKRGPWTPEGSLAGEEISSCVLFTPLNGSFLYCGYYGSESQFWQPTAILGTGAKSGWVMPGEGREPMSLSTGELAGPISISTPPLFPPQCRVWD